MKCFERTVLGHLIHIITHILAREPLSFDLNSSTVAWVTYYLTRRPCEDVTIHGTMSDIITKNTGAPQATLLSLLLFRLYTSDYRHGSDSCHRQKLSDDSALVGYIFNNDYAACQREVDSFIRWSKATNVIVNVDRTKELLIWDSPLGSLILIPGCSCRQQAGLEGEHQCYL